MELEHEELHGQNPCLGEALGSNLHPDWEVVSEWVLHDGHYSGTPEVGKEPCLTT